jgi:hypothetical protein
MSSPTLGLMWQIWFRNRKAIWSLIAVLCAGIVFAAVFGDLVHASHNDRFSRGTTLAAGIVGEHLFGAAFLLTLWICSFTEFNPSRGTTGFPHRLFVLPISSFRLVAVPMAFGVIGMELVCGALLLIRESAGESLAPYALLLGVYMVLHQTVLWTVNLRSGRILVLGVLAVLFIMLPLVRFGARYSNTTQAVALIGLGVGGFLSSWVVVARQRSGGGSVGRWSASMLDPLIARLPARQKPFVSPLAAQFWFEWRRSGTVLPSLVAGVIIGIIAPISWYYRDDPGDTLRILIMTLVMPVLLALPVGKAFSKPDFWSSDLTVPPILAVRPLSTTDFVVTKLRVAASATAMSWGLVIAFVSIWLPFWANPAAVHLMQQIIRRLYGNSEYSLYGVVALLVLAGMLLTWRFLVSNLWLGLSGNRPLFTVSALPYGVLTPVALVLFLVFLRNEESYSRWLHQNLDRLLPTLEWIAAGAILVKVALAIFSWHRVRRHHVLPYLMFWGVGTGLMVISAVVLSSAAVQALIVADSNRLRMVLVLGALLVVPLTRVAWAPMTLARNRHR